MSEAPGGSSILDRAPCPKCGEPWLRPTQLPGRLRCVNCLSRFELVSQCPECGEHQTIARMTHTADMQCQMCGASHAETDVERLHRLASAP